MNFLTKLFIKKGENPKNEKVRERCGKNAGILCIILNSLLAGGKIVVGAISGAISVLADGLNNLTDCGSNVVSVIGFKMSGKPADKEHPFGHQRAESISAFLISTLIIFVAVELLITSIEKIITPVKNEFSVYLIVVLAVAVAVKLFMFLLNRTLGKATDSEALKATGADSLSDSISTLAVLIALIISHYTDVILDGYAGVAVSLFIGFTGVKLLLETISHLIGKAPDAETVKMIEERVLTFPEVHGIHDLAVHIYGQNKMYATVHVEVDCDIGIMHSHDLADAIEKDFLDNTNVILTVHIDPLVLSDPKVNELRDYAYKIVYDIDPTFKMHDFRMVGGKTHANMVFDVAVPFDSKLTLSEIEQKIKDRVYGERQNLGVVVTVERQMTDPT